MVYGAVCQDTYGVRTRNTKPVEDKQSNVELIRGEETEAGTTIQFKRKWNTGDTEHDIAIKVWLWHVKVALPR